MKDYYKILGVEKSASKDEIKKAFRKLAHEHHPDKTKGDKAAEQRFKEASEAYSVLSDDAKRKQYDTFGSAGPGGAGFNGQGGFGGFDFSSFAQGFGQNGAGGVEFDLGDIFGEFFGGGRGSSRTRTRRGEDISLDIQISFEESIFGVERDLIVSKMASCLTCSGSGAAPGSGMDTCPKCQGSGQLNETRRSFIGIINSARACDRCHGKGQIPKTPCPTCRGDGVVEREQELSVKVPPGIENGQMLRLDGMGEAIAGGMPGDLYVRVRVKPHPHIRKDGYNLITDKKLKLTEAIAGGEIPLATLDGELMLKIPEGTNTGDILRLKGKGVPASHGNKRGDMLVRIQIDMPKRLSKTARQALETLKEEGL